MAIPYRQSAADCFPDGLPGGAEARATYPGVLQETRSALDRIRHERDGGTMPHWQLPFRTDDLAGIGEAAARLRAFDEVVVLATGGSSLGGRALTDLVPGGPGAARPRLRFLENLDPFEHERFLRHFDPARTAFVVISKSGGTAETLSQALVCLDAVRRAPAAGEVAAQFLVVCEPGDSPLRRLAAREGIAVLEHDPDLGGRYSVLSVVGMLPALIAGLDAGAVRDGAASVLAQALAAADPADVPAAVGAAVAVTLQRTCGVSMNVLMPYAGSLDSLARWYCQLWAESLGKDGKGLTPVRALGPMDQHSQLQLYLDGPADKQFTLICLDLDATGPRVPERDADALGIGYLGGATIGDLVAAQQQATAETLARRGRSVRVLQVPTMDERGMGALFMHFMLETVLAAHLLGVNPFDQPAVEEGKVLARQALAGRVRAGAAS